ncbi:MAG: epoxide hydrolase 1 [Novosphingobium sp.]|nr:epoxide hydrolase 1 [Novosphingobium sp.]
MTISPEAFEIAVPIEKLTGIERRVRDFPWHNVPYVPGWTAGASRAFMQSLCAYWVDRFDWRAAERNLNRHPQFKARIDGIDIHFYHVKGSAETARPLLLLHGWPGSVAEFHPLIERLSDPARHGGDAADGFDLVIPSLPGYGFSGCPAAPIGARDAAAIMVRLMTEVLDYDAYISQGGDWGGILSSWIGMLDPVHCAGIHLNMTMPAKPDAGSADEMAWAERFAGLQQVEGAYGRIQMTRPQSLGFAMADSPVGVAAWIVEKFAAWSDLPRTPAGEPDLLSRYSYDELLANVMIYLAEDKFISSTWLYHGSVKPGQLPFSDGGRCDVPTAIAAFPDPVFIPPPRSLSERFYNVVRWTRMPRGGHFAAMEAPDLFVDDVQAFGRQIFG